MRLFLSILALAAAMAMPAGADTEAETAPEPILKIINFTADWCPNCQVLNPRIDAALQAFEAHEIERVDLDMTEAQGTDEVTKAAAVADAIRTADANKAGYLWDWYGGSTGIAAIISADNGEPISCLNRILTADQIEMRLTEAKVLALRAPAGARKPAGPDCPAPIN